MKVDRKGKWNGMEKEMRGEKRRKHLRDKHQTFSMEEHISAADTKLFR